MTTQYDMRAEQQRADSYVNTTTGLGGMMDKARATRAVNFEIGFQELENMYLGDGLAARIVDCVVDDATRADWHVEDANGEIDETRLRSKLDDLGAVQACADAWRWARLYGHAVIVLVCNDGEPMDAPLRRRDLFNVSALHVIEGPAAMPVWDSTRGLGQSAYTEPDYYEIITANGAARRIHRSRCIPFVGTRLPPMFARRHGSLLGRSVLSRVWERITGIATALGYTESIMHEVSVMALKLSDFRNQCQTDGGRAQLDAAVATMKACADNQHVLVLDKEDEYAEIKRDLTPFPGVIDQLANAACWYSGIPRTVLMGTQAGGLATNDGEMRAWYDTVARLRDGQVTPALTRIIDLVLTSWSNKSRTRAPSQWTLAWGSLWEPTDLERAQYEQGVVAASVQIVTAGLADLDEERERLIALGVIRPLDEAAPESAVSALASLMSEGGLPSSAPAPESAEEPPVGVGDTGAP